MHESSISILDPLSYTFLSFLYVPSKTMESSLEGVVLMSRARLDAFSFLEYITHGEIEP